MIAHVVLFRPRPALTDAARDALLDAIARACTEIAVLKRAHVGQRRVIGRAYDRYTAEDYPYAAIFEFESEDDLRTYLDHPAHEALGAQFYATSEAALAMDFVLIDGRDARTLFA